MHHFEFWHIPIPGKLLEFGNPGIGTRLVGNLQVKRWVRRTDARGDLSLGYRPPLWHFDHFAVIAKTDSLFSSQRPEKAVDRFVDPFAIHAFSLVGIGRRDRLLSEVGNVGSGGPDVALRADL